jgi:AraC family transcriptional regulator
MAASSLLIGVEAQRTFDCTVRSSAKTPVATIELHEYEFHGPQHSEFCLSRGFLDLALSRRPGEPSARFLDAPACGACAIGDVVFVPAGVRLKSEWGGGRQSSVCLEFHDYGEVDNCWTERALASSLDVQSPFVRDALVRLARELDEPGFQSTLMIEALSIQLGIELGRYFRGQESVAPPRAGCLSTRQVRLVEDRIDVPGPLPSVTELARECGTSSRHFFRMFRATMGMTLSDYAAKRRMARARARLTTERVPIKQVAWECGFETPAAFSAAFRRATGFRPREYRQLLSS